MQDERGTALPPPADGQVQAPQESADEAFALVLLHALVTMARRSKRRQADLTAALRGAGLQAEPSQVRAALRLLAAQGCVEALIPLSDGGLLLSVTSTGIERLSGGAPWVPLDLQA